MDCLGSLPGSSRTSPTLTVVIPTYNSVEHIYKTLETLSNELERAFWKNAAIIVVNDGSTDETVAAVKRLETSVPISVITQENAGRFEARRTGIKAADSEWILLLDARVFLGDRSMQFLLEQTRDHPNREMWNAHIDVRAETLVGRFWIPITQTAWRRYYQQETRTFSIGSHDYDRYPKGTTCFLIKKSILIRAVDNFKSTYDDLRYANDDTALIRSAIAHSELWFDRRFRAEYVARTSPAQFVRHSFHRGIVFLDGHILGNSRYGKMFVAAAILSVGVLASGALYPQRTLGVCAALYALTLVSIALASQSDFRSMVSFALFAPIFVVVFAAGVMRGMLMMLSQSVRRRSQRRAEVKIAQ